MRAGGKLAEVAAQFNLSAAELRAECEERGIAGRSGGVGKHKKAIPPGTKLRRETIDVGTPRRVVKLSLSYLTADEVDVTYLEDRIEIRPVR